MSAGRARGEGGYLINMPHAAVRPSIAWIESINKPLVVILEEFPFMWNISKERLEGVIPHKNKEGQLD